MSRRSRSDALIAPRGNDAILGDEASWRQLERLAGHEEVGRFIAHLAFAPVPDPEPFDPDLMALMEGGPRAIGRRPATTGLRLNRHHEGGGHG